MDKIGMFGEMLEKGQQTVQKTVKSAVSDVASSVSSQLAVKPEVSPDASGKAQTQSPNQNQTQIPPAESVTPQAASTPETIDLVKEFYAPSEDQPAVNVKNPQQEQLEKQQKLAKLRQELHQETYYDPLIAYEKKKLEQQEEGGAAERVEKQKKEEEQKKMQLEEKKAKETQDLATARAQRKTEANPGVAG
ncbi:MAG: hypothetical protein ABSD69_00510 [Candidatus Levyibacteriota bacterium]|jgi:hypothetical protein